MVGETSELLPRAPSKELTAAVVASYIPARRAAR